MTYEEVCVDIVESIGYPAWINQPSTSQRLHRFHGRRGIVIPNRRDELEFYFVPRDTVDRAVSVLVSDSEISR
jgi:hypothetical protein